MGRSVLVVVLFCAGCPVQGANQSTTSTGDNAWCIPNGGLSGTQTIQVRPGLNYTPNDAVVGIEWVRENFLARLQSGLAYGQLTLVDEGEELASDVIMSVTLNNEDDNNFRVEVTSWGESAKFYFRQEYTTTDALAAIERAADKSVEFLVGGWTCD